MGLAVDRGDHSLEILEMIIRRHVVGEAVHLIGYGVISDIHENEDILASCGILQHSFSFSGREAGKNEGKPVIFLIVSLIGRVIPVFIVVAYTEIVDPLVYFLTEFLRGRKNDQGKRGNGVARLLKFVMYYVFCGHEISFINVVENGSLCSTKLQSLHFITIL